jgi:hypothetical protein
MHPVKTLQKKILHSFCVAVPNGLTCSVLVLLSLQVMAQEDSMSKIQVIPKVDSVSTINTGSPADSSSKNSPEDNLAKPDVTAQEELAPNIAKFGKIDLVNIALTNKKIRAMGWGEYVVGGHCLCCDNMRSIDCITVQTTNRTDKLRIKQIVDGKIERDTVDNSTYFGGLFEREMQTKPVVVLMAEITWPKLQDIYKIVVYTVADSLKKKNVPFNCELAYMDQFDRLQWAKKVENSGHDDHITFDLEKPIFTKNILLKIKDGRNKISEVSIFAENKSE